MKILKILDNGLINIKLLKIMKDNILITLSDKTFLIFFINI